MTAQQALQLSILHNLGSARNTLAPGVVLPAYNDGMDPNEWATRVRALGLTRLQPAGSDTSLYKFSNVPGSFDIGSSAPGGSTIMVKKSPEEQQQAINLMIQALTPASAAGAGGSPNAGNWDGSWMVGNDWGGLQSAVLSKAQLDEQARQAARRDALTAQSLAQQAQQNERNFQLTLAQQGRSASQQDLANELAMLDRLDRQGQLTFENQTRLAQLRAQMGDASALTSAGSAVVDATGKAYQDHSAAVAALNDEAMRLAQGFNENAGEGGGVGVRLNSKGIAEFVPDKNTRGAAMAALMQQYTASPAYAALTAATEAMNQAELQQARLPYLPKTQVALPPVPTANPAIAQILQRMGVIPQSVAQPAAPASRAVPYLTLDSRSRAAARSAVPSLPGIGTGNVTWLGDVSDLFSMSDIPDLPVASAPRISTPALAMAAAGSVLNPFNWSGGPAPFPISPSILALINRLAGGGGSAPVLGKSKSTTLPAGVVVTRKS